MRKIKSALMLGILLVCTMGFIKLADNHKTPKELTGTLAQRNEVLSYIEALADYASSDSKISAQELDDLTHKYTGIAPNLHHYEYSKDINTIARVLNDGGGVQDIAEKLQVVINKELETTTKVIDTYIPKQEQEKVEKLLETNTVLTIDKVEGVLFEMSQVVKTVTDHEDIKTYTQQVKTTLEEQGYTDVIEALTGVKDQKEVQSVLTALIDTSKKQLNAVTGEDSKEYSTLISKLRGYANNETTEKHDK